MQLNTFLKERGMTHREFADALGCEQPTVSRFASGNRIPSPDLMRKIVEITGGAVTPNDFYDVECHEAASAAADAAASSGNSDKISSPMERAA